MTWLIVDVDVALDSCEAGRAAAVELQTAFDTLRAKAEAVRSKGTSTAGMRQANSAAEALEREGLNEIEAMREQKRRSLLTTIEALASQIAAERGAFGVLHRGALVAVGSAEDITPTIIARLNR